MSNYKTHAWEEFRAAGWLDEHGQFKDEMQEAICSHVLKLLDVFAEEGHSGSSAPYAISLFEKLAKFEPIAPITGEDWEWHEASDGVFQNRRCSHVFKQADRFNGQPYDIDAKVFWEWMEFEGEMTKSYFTSGDSFVPIEFPYVPKREYVFRPSERFPNETLDA
jgi:hypothetical protein